MWKSNLSQILNFLRFRNYNAKFESVPADIFDMGRPGISEYFFILHLVFFDTSKRARGQRARRSILARGPEGRFFGSSKELLTGPEEPLRAAEEV